MAIIWTNKNIIPHGKMVDYMNFINDHICGSLPLYGKEKKILFDYAIKNYVSAFLIFSLRDTIKIQKEINCCKFRDRKIDIIKNKFLQNVHKYENFKIKKIFETTCLPFNTVYKTITNLPEYKLLDDKNRRYLQKLKILVDELEIKKKEKSVMFENILEKYLNSRCIRFYTEREIITNNLYSVTPDFLFHVPITIELNNIKYKIKWMDAKNYALNNVNFILKSLQKQAKKYNQEFGMGAFVFNYGIDPTIKIPNVLILDGSFIKKYKVQK